MPALASGDRLVDRNARPRRLGGIEARQLGHPGGATLDGRISATWSNLVETGAAECPVCDRPLQAGRACAGCGSELT